MKFAAACRTGLAAAALTVGTFAAQAAPLTFFGSDPAAGGVFPSAKDPETSLALLAQTAFAAQVVATGTETFEASTPGFIGATGNRTPVFGGGTLRQTSPDSASDLAGAEVKFGSAESGRFNTTGGSATGRWIETDWNFTLDIGQRVGAFAFFGTDFGDFDGRLAIELFDGLTRVAANVFLDATDQPLVTGPGDGSLLFFGYASDVLFDRIEFRISQAAGTFDTLGFDDIRVGNLRQVSPPPGNVPEPGSLVLAGLALLAAAWARRARPST